MDISGVSKYELIERHPIKELDTVGYILKHRKTGARVVLMENDDDNKVFYIGFRTPPSDSTGVMHILEHSVLCGSKNFPVKDPFLELAKGSLNTFLNAMTYPDKTVYPVASCNDKDFQNLMHVYLDAVFYPRILDSDMTFKQEGWHYELPDKDSELTINGVVYSEMKGAFSSPDDVLERELFNSLFPDTPYGKESGGDPDDIPKLTYKHYIDTYKSYYHPSNSYIYLYGNMNMAEKLDFIDREYLSRFDAIEIDSTIPLQKAFDKPVEIVKEFSVTEDEPVKENTYLSLNFAMKDNLDREAYIAWQIIDYALCDAQGAVLKQALLDKGIGKDVYSIYDGGVRQPYFSIVAKYSDEDKKEEFLSTIKEVLTSIVKSGFNKDTLRAGLNAHEFRYREADFGNYPPGLMYGLQVLDSWLYDDNKPFIHIEADATFASLRKKIDTDYYEQLILKGLIENKHSSFVMVCPKVGLNDVKEEELKKSLAEYKSSLSVAEIEKLVSDSAALLAYQDEEDSEEALATIPVLKISDIRKETAPLYNVLREIDGIKVLYHPIATKGIDYVRVMFDASGLSKDSYKYLSLLKSVLGVMDTDNYSYAELFDKIYIETGGITTATTAYENAYDRNDRHTYFDLKGKCLSGDLSKVFDLFEEILVRTKYDDTVRLLEIINEIKSHNQSTMISAGHMVAMQRALSYVSGLAKTMDTLQGLDAYRLTEDISLSYDKEKENTVKCLKTLSDSLFKTDNLMFDFTGSEDEYREFTLVARKLIKALGNGSKEDGSAFAPKLKVENEGLKSASQVQYVCRAGNFVDKGLKYTGALRVLKVMMGYDYLWNNIRVKGGAYGCMSGFSKNGDGYFVSYRDPHLKETINIYEGIPGYLEGFNADERTMTQYIIGAISALDTPLTPQGKAIRSLVSYMTNQDEESYQTERDELLGTTPEVIRGLSKHCKAILEDKALCVVGGDNKIEENKAIFGKTEPLFKG